MFKLLTAIAILLAMPLTELTPLHPCDSSVGVTLTIHTPIAPLDEQGRPLE